MNVFKKYDLLVLHIYLYVTYLDLQTRIYTYIYMTPHIYLLINRHIYVNLHTSYIHII